MTKYSREKIEFLKNNVKGITLKELTKKFNKKFNLNVSEKAIEHQKYKLGLRSGIAGGRFEKGCTPFNKGKKWSEYMSQEGQANSRKTTFKKGNIPNNHKEVGYERTNLDGYIEVKVAEPNLFKLKHRIIYEKHYGSIPKGYNICFADGNKQNLDINNLILVSSAEELIMNKNKLFKQDQDLTKTGLIISKVLNKAKKRN